MLLNATWLSFQANIQVGNQVPSHFTINSGYEIRPDLVSNLINKKRATLFVQTVKNWWIDVLETSKMPRGKRRTGNDCKLTDSSLLIQLWSEIVSREMPTLTCRFARHNSTGSHLGCERVASAQSRFQKLDAFSQQQGGRPFYNFTRDERPLLWWWWSSSSFLDATIKTGWRDISCLHNNWPVVSKVLTDSITS